MSIKQTVKTHCPQTHRDPKQSKGQADLPMKVQGNVSVIPNGIAAVGEQAGEQLHGCDDPGSGQCPQRQRQRGPGLIKLSQ